MATNFKLKRSSVANKRPGLTNLELGELALNTYDGFLFTERNGLGITTVANITPWYENYGAGSIFYTNRVGIGTTAVPATNQLLVKGGTETDRLNVTGVSTFGGIIEASAGQNKIPFLYSSMTDLPSAGSYHGAVAHVHATGSLYYAHAGNWWELVNKESDGRVGTGTEVYNVASINSSGIITAATELNSPLIGVGTDAPANAIQVRKTGNAEIQVTSDTGIAGLTIGREPSTANTNNAEFRYGGGSGAPYSTSQSLDIINYGTDNFNYHLSANNPGGVVGDFIWHKGLKIDVFLPNEGN